MKTNINFSSHLSFLLRMRNVSDKSCKENQNILSSVTFFFSKTRAVYEIMWKNIVERGRPQMKIWQKCIACRIPKATNTHKLMLSNNHCLSTATIIARTRLSVTLHVHCPSCYSSTQLSDV